MRIDASEIIPGLFQGSRPPTGRHLHAEGFSVLVLAAKEYQPNLEEFPGLSLVVHAGIGDDPSVGMSHDEWDTAQRAARIVAKHVLLHNRVLVTCRAGVNRSGMISALAARYVTGMSGRMCVDLVRKNRGPQRVGDNVLIPLCNPSFAVAIDALPQIQRKRR